MSALILWSVLGVYALGWYLAAPRIARELPTATSHCHRENNTRFQWSTKDGCRDDCGPTCWRADADAAVLPGHVIAGVVLALLWPLALIGWDVSRRAKGKPSRHDLSANIARLERELNWGDAS